MRTSAQPPIGSTWQLGSVSEPRPPVGCSPRVRPFPPRPPRKLPSFVRSLPRYYDLIRLLIRVHARRTASAFPSRPGTSPGTGETCRVDEDVTTLAPHRSGRADFQHPVPHRRASFHLV